MQKPCFRVKNTAHNLHKVESSYNVERLEVSGGFINVWLIPITRQFIESKQLTINYVKKDILK